MVAKSSTRLDAKTLSTERSLEKSQATRSQLGAQAERALKLLGVVVLAGGLGIVLYAMQTSNFGAFFSVVGVSLLIAGAFTLAGAFLGFLFGIPHTMPQESSSGTQTQVSATNTAEGSTSQAKVAENNGPAYQANTNLEQISDWLTKILVGVGLTQIGQIPSALQGYASFVSPGLGGFSNSSKAFAVGLLIYYLIAGFLIGYLWTRLYLAGALRKADLDSSIFSERISQVEEKLSLSEQQDRFDASADRLVNLQLNPDPSPDAKGVEQADLNEAIRKASTTKKSQIFYIAQAIRQDNWSEPKDKPKMALTIPIFRALIESDPDENYHQNHGQLGFALKDLPVPQWGEALGELSKAIEIRDTKKQTGHLFYEFNRALCDINLDSSFKNGQPSSPDIKDSIVCDLKAAFQASKIKGIILSDQVIQGWMNINQVTGNDLTA